MGRMSGSDTPRPLEVFFSYAHKDEDLVRAVRGQLSLFDRQKLIRRWHDRQIPPGSDWKGIIDAHLTSADIILLFVSPDFFESDYCYDVEMKKALERHTQGDARVVPVILRPSAWEAAPFAHLNALPTGGVPVTTWPNRDEACLDIARGVLIVVDELSRRSDAAVATVAATDQGETATASAASRREAGLPPSAAAPELTRVQCSSALCRSEQVDLTDIVEITGLRDEGDRWVGRGVVQIAYAVNGVCQTCGRIFEVVKGAIPLQFPDLTCNECGQHATLQYKVKDLTRVANGYEFAVEVRCGECSGQLTFSRVLTSLLGIAGIDVEKMGFTVRQKAR